MKFLDEVRGYSSSNSAMIAYPPASFQIVGDDLVIRVGSVRLVVPASAVRFEETDEPCA